MPLVAKVNWSPVLIVLLAESGLSGGVGEWDADHVTCLRSCLMKPDHREWLPEILSRLALAAAEA